MHMYEVRIFLLRKKTLNGIIYCDMLELWLMPQLLQDKPHVFQHDRAPTHSHYEMTTFLNRQLPKRWIGRRGPTFWPPRRPDLTLLEFFLWGFVKDEVYLPSMLINLNNLKDRIRTAIAKIDQPLLQNVWHEVE
jgi:hypothetical protein